jgi:hypothetical protein
VNGGWAATVTLCPAAWVSVYLWRRCEGMLAGRRCQLISRVMRDVVRVPARTVPESSNHPWHRATKAAVAARRACGSRLAAARVGWGRWIQGSFARAASLEMTGHGQALLSLCLRAEAASPIELESRLVYNC